MRRLQVLALLAGAAAAFGGGPVAVAHVAGGRGGPAVGRAAVRAARAAGSWGRAIEVPHMAALDTGGNGELPYAGLPALSCASAGNCAAGGYYTDSHGHTQGFVVSEKNGRWHWAIEVPGLGALNRYGTAEVTSVSCVSAGNCAAGGQYTGRHNRGQGFVVSERHGRWGRAIGVPNLWALNKGAYQGGGADVTSVSCTSAGNCAAGGYYLDQNRNRQGFVVSEKNGRWHWAIEVPGLGALNTGASPYGGAAVNSVSCASAGNCAVGGYYSSYYNITPSFNQQAFVAIERNGHWGKAIEVPGTAAMNTGNNAAVNSVSCPSAGGCTVAGTWRRLKQQGFVASERHGRWREATSVPGLHTLNTYGTVAVGSLSCTSVGNCTTGGTYNVDPNALGVSGYVATETNGHWGHAIEVPGLAALNTGEEGSVQSVSCGSPGNCAAGGYYADVHGYQGFVVSEKNGHWERAIEVPGVAGLSVEAVSCPREGSCTAGGGYGTAPPFVTTDGTRTRRASPSPGIPGQAPLTVPA